MREKDLKTKESNNASLLLISVEFDRFDRSEPLQYTAKTLYISSGKFKN
jgi:hypothetical protein